MASAPMHSDPDPSDPPRTFSEYGTTAHFHDRVNDTRRPVDLAHARSAVEHGAVEPNPTDRNETEWRFRRPIDGLEIVVPAGVTHHDDVGGVSLFTAYADVANANVAEHSHTWGREDVHTAALLQYLDGRNAVTSANLPPHDIHVDNPVPCKGHRVVLKRGYTSAYCVRCGAESESVGRYTRQPCR